MSSREISVGMLIGAHHQGANAVILQRRAREDSWPRACQLSAHGKVELNELQFPDARALSSGLLREVKEELGPTMQNKIAAAVMAKQMALVVQQADRELGPEISSMLRQRFRSNPHTLELLKTLITEKKVVLSFGFNSGEDASTLCKVIEGETDVRFEICTEHTALLPLGKRFKNEVVPENEIRMFPDEIEAVQMAFKVLFAPKVGVEAPSPGIAT